jgi:hypothetical protein
MPETSAFHNHDIDLFRFTLCLDESHFLSSSDFHDWFALLVCHIIHARFPFAFAHFSGEMRGMRALI